MKKTFLLLFTALLLITACKKEEPKVENIKPVTDNKTKIVTINGKAFYDTDFFNFAGATIRALSPKDYDNKNVKDKLINDFVEHNLLLAEAEKKHIQVDDAKINAVLESFNTESGAQNLKVYSLNYNTDPKILAKIIREKMLVEAYLYDKVNTEITVTEEEIKAEYNKTYANIKPHQKAHIFQIVTTDKAIAEKAMAELKRGLSFNEVAARYSAGPEKDFGGDLGFIQDDDYPEIFSEAFKLQPGKYSGIIKSEYGYHIFLVKGYNTPKKISYDQVKNQIHFAIYNEKQDKKIRELINELKKNSNIQYGSDINIADFIAKSKSRSNR